MDKSVRLDADSFNLQIKEQIERVTVFAEFLGRNGVLDSPENTDFLEIAVENNNLFDAAIAYPDGSFMTPKGKGNGNLSESDLFIANMRGDFFMTDSRAAVTDETKEVILFSAPIFSDTQQVIGAVIYSYLTEDLDKIFGLNAIDGEKEIVVAAQNGEVLTGNTRFVEGGGNLLENLRAQCIHRDHPAEDCLVLSGSGGIGQATIDGGKEVLYVPYTALGYKNWYMMEVVPQSSSIFGIDHMMDKLHMLSASVLIIIGLYLWVSVVAWRRRQRFMDLDTGTLTLEAFRKESESILKKHKAEDFVVIKLDVKDFKLINRMYSFEIGDKVIENIAKALQGTLKGDQSIYAQIGVDIFVILMPYEGEKALVEKHGRFMNTVREMVNEHVNAHIIFPTGQYVIKPGDYAQLGINEILERVNFSHQVAKRSSNRIIDYKDDIENLARFEKNIENRMEGAVDKEEFSLYLQPKICLEKEAICGAEALVRWEVDGKMYMYPSDFIPVLERNGFIVQLDKYMFTRTLQFLQSCLEAGKALIPISVNFSRLHLNNKKFVDELCAIADGYDVPRAYLEIEITESAFLGDIHDIKQFVEEIHRSGFKISMDDFGSGYSSFAQLKDLKIDVLKIDRGFFLEEEEEKERSRVVIAGILAIAQKLGIITVAEGIEYGSQVEMLRELGCDIIQGYFYARPMPAEDLDIEHFEVP